MTAVLLVPAAQGQTRSETGRHKPVPPPPTEEKEATVENPAEGPIARPWYFGFGGGVQGGSDLFRVEVVDGPPVPWDPESGGGFQSARFTASLDRNPSFNLFLGRRLGKTWSVRLDYGYSQMDVAAEALVGQTGAVFLYDQMSVINLGLGVEARLTQESSYPYMEASLLFSHLGPTAAAELEQWNLGGRIGLGFLQKFHQFWGIRFGARLAVTGFSVGDYVPQTSLPSQPVIDYQTQDSLTFFEFLIALQVSL